MSALNLILYDVLGQKKVQLPQGWFGTQQWPPSVTLRDPNAMTSCETVCIYRHISHGNRKSLTREFKIPLSFLRSRRRIKNDKRTMGADGDWHLVPAYFRLQAYRFTGLFLVKSAPSLCSLFRTRFGS